MPDVFAPAPLDPFERFLQQRRREASRFRQREARFTQSAQRRLRDRAAREASERAIKEAGLRSARVAAAARAGLLSNIGGALVLGAELITQAIREQQENRIALEMEAQNANIQRKLDRRAKEKVLATTGVRRSTVRSDSTGQFPDRDAAPKVLSAPRASAPETGAILHPSGGFEVDVIGRPIDPDFRTTSPVISPPGRPSLEPQPFEDAPGVQPAPFPAGDPLPAPVQQPIPLPPLATPGFGVPAPTPAPRGSPLFQPFPSPVQFPVFQPTGLPRSVPPRGTAPKVLTPFNIEPLNFPDPTPQPQPETQRRRCKPCPKKKKEKPRDKCFKGLYREKEIGIDFTEFAEVDCMTGVEISKPTGKPVGRPRGS